MINNNESKSIVIEAGSLANNYWRDIWSYRELLFFLAWRDVLVRYKQTAIGMAWALLRPLLTMAVFTIVFSKLAGLSSGDTPYAILVLAGLLPWQFFANALSDSSNSMLNNAGMISKVYFPRLIVPISSAIVSSVDFFISFAILMLLMIAYDMPFTIRLLVLPFYLLYVFVAALGAGIWLAALNTKYKDFRYIVPFMIQFGLYISPVGYSANLVPEDWRWLYSLNPLVSIINGFRWAILGEGAISWSELASSFCLVMLVLYSGLRYFRMTEKNFADVI